MSTTRRRLNWHLANKKTSNSNNGPIADNEEPRSYFSNASAVKYFIDKTVTPPTPIPRVFFTDEGYSRLHFEGMSFSVYTSLQ
jgi:hypothetical protein